MKSKKKETHSKKEVVVMSPIQENPDQLKAFQENPNEGPFVMLNLLKFKREGGIDSYAQYTKKVVPFLSGVGAEMIYLGKAGELLQGSEAKDDWDAVMLVRYPNRKALLKMSENPGYQEVHQYRAAGLERAVLLATDEMSVRELFFAKK
jgi:uncharacterized protein (DUF1330 family)